MQIVVNHLTRMRAGGRICVAGIDPRTGLHVRPTTAPTDPITRRLLRAEGGPLAIGALVDIGEVRPDPNPPETEDHRGETRSVRQVRDLASDEYVKLLDDARAAGFESALGPALERVGWKFAVPVGTGERSLAVVRPRTRPQLQIDKKYGRLQLRLDDPHPPTYIPVTDVRFYESDQETIRVDVVNDVNRRLQRGVGSYLMLGLARAFRASTDDRERHWLQLNGVCLVDQPVGEAP